MSTFPSHRTRTPEHEPLLTAPDRERSDARAIGDSAPAPPRPAEAPQRGRDDRAAPPPPGRAAPGPGECGLRFEQPGGPLVVVCGLHGGAGTSTLAFALAAQAARESPPGRVLLCESEAAAGDLEPLTGARSRYSLGELAGELQAGRRPSGFLAGAGPLRVITGAPGPAPRVQDGATARVLVAARRRQALAVVDAGTLRFPGTRELLAAATHVIWVLAAWPGAAARARALLASPLVPALTARQLLAIRGSRRRALAGAERRELRRLAEAQCDRLVFAPDSPGATGARVELDDARVRATLTELARFLDSPSGA